MIDRFTNRDLLELIFYLDFIILIICIYNNMQIRNCLKDNKILYNMIKKISGDFPN